MIYRLGCQDSNLEPSDPESDVLPIAPQPIHRGAFKAKTPIVSTVQRDPSLKRERQVSSPIWERTRPVFATPKIQLARQNGDPTATKSTMYRSPASVTPSTRSPYMTKKLVTRFPNRVSSSQGITLRCVTLRRPRALWIPP